MGTRSDTFSDTFRVSYAAGTTHLDTFCIDPSKPGKTTRNWLQEAVTGFARGWPNAQANNKTAESAVTTGMRDVV
jgi:hypothetical protein